MDYGTFRGYQNYDLRENLGIYSVGTSRSFVDTSIYKEKKERGYSDAVRSSRIKSY